MDSLSESTLAQYNTTYKYWWSFAQDRNYETLCPTEKQVLHFLRHQYQNKNLRFGSLNTIRSALSLISDKNIGNNPVIKRFMKGIFRQKPPSRKYNYIWDTETVLKFLENSSENQRLSLMVLTNFWPLSRLIDYKLSRV